MADVCRSSDVVIDSLPVLSSEEQVSPVSDNAAQVAAKAHGVASSTDKAIKSPEIPQPQFPLFSKLPFELRCMIWRYAMTGPRAIHIKLATKRTHSFIFQSELATAKMKAMTSIPGVLHAVYESRNIALKHYSIAFADHERIPTMFFNYEHDYLHISLILLDSLFPHPYQDKTKTKDKTLIKIRNLMIGPTCQLSPLALNRQLIRFFETLKHVIIPHKYAPGDMRKARHENFGRAFFLRRRSCYGDHFPGLDLEYKCPREILEMSRGLRR
ncbi:hypothetical protein VTL71DRAFT_7953 [Oculimacula yallundae]|uniref:2EXR domain-containing protein n=1 Tax=Oculimacula yallundae TaxID=86028 RepID=A0ABR4CWB1_9HELO